MDVQSNQVAIPVNGETMPGYLSRPQGRGPFSALVIVHAIYGLTPDMEEVARRVAGLGYIALVPNLFFNLKEQPNFTDRASFARFRNSLDDPEILNMLGDATHYLKDLPEVSNEQVGIMGFCMGGYYAFLEAIRDPSLACCVDFYGAPLVRAETSEKHPLSPLEVADEMRVPFLGLFGAEDQSIPVEQVEKLKAVLKTCGVPIEIHIYPNAGHAFFNPGPQYREKAAQDAWERVKEFLQKYLAQG